MHVMLDLETLGTTPDAAVLEIGAVAFTMDGVIHDRFFCAVSAADAAKKRCVSGDTVLWWLSQSDEARTRLLENQSRGAVSLDEALSSFERWVSQFESPLAGVWSNGATFDISMIEDALRQAGQEPPWPFWAARDCRTIEALAAEIGVTRKQFKREGVHHNALDDAVYQAAYVSGMWRALTKDNPPGR